MGKKLVDKNQSRARAADAASLGGRGYLVFYNRSMDRAPRDFFKMLGSSAYGIVLVGLFWLVYSPVPCLIIHNESRAKYRLRDISGTALQYAEKFDGFYPQGSSLLAPRREDLHARLPRPSLGPSIL